MDALTPAVHACALVVLVSGGAKVVSPAGFAGLLSTFGVPGSRWLARLAGLAELLFAAAVLVIGGAIVTLCLGVAYLLFAVVVVLARRRGVQDCGCFGVVASAPPNVLHVLVNLAAAAVLLVAGLTVPGPPALGDVIATQPLVGVLYLALVVLVAWMVVAIDTSGAVVLDRLAAVSRRRPKRRHRSGEPESL